MHGCRTKGIRAGQQGGVGMKDSELRALFQNLTEIYKMRPEVAQEILRKILEILHGGEDRAEASDGA